MPGRALWVGVDKTPAIRVWAGSEDLPNNGLREHRWTAACASMIGDQYVVAATPAKGSQQAGNIGSRRRCLIGQRRHDGSMVAGHALQPSADRCRLPLAKTARGGRKRGSGSASVRTATEG